MCPACIAVTTVIVAGAGSTDGILALSMGKLRKILKSESPRSNAKKKGELKWQRAKTKIRSRTREK